ncbi:MAG: 50S ribosomal protein L6 [Clostridia bacterium]|nr:50S ribosomal protein L6 [Clostridia bacterium]
MSRIGRAPITVPAGVTVNVGDNNQITVKGPKGELTYKAPASIKVEMDGPVLHISRPDDEAQNRALHGLTRTLIHNMVVGVSEGYTKKLEIVGVGYRAAKEGKRLVLNLGHSHPIYFEETDLVQFDVPDANTIIVKSFDKQVCGQVAADIRSKRPPEPYHGKGVKYSGEHIRRKAGKAGK